MRADPAVSRLLTVKGPFPRCQLLGNRLSVPPVRCCPTCPSCPGRRRQCGRSTSRRRAREAGVVGCEARPRKPRTDPASVDRSRDPFGDSFEGVRGAGFRQVPRRSAQEIAGDGFAALVGDRVGTVFDATGTWFCRRPPSSAVPTPARNPGGLRGAEPPPCQPQCSTLRRLACPP